jgi:hypothetical protein
MSDAPYFLNLYDPIRNLSFVKLKHLRSPKKHISQNFGFCGYIWKDIMTKQTNPFQRFIKNIYEQLAENNSDVVESAMLKEIGVTDPREVDIHVKKNILGREIKFAVECRKHGRKDDIGWMDSLVGKYVGMRDKVDEVIAVSGSGFTVGAKEKAAQYNIKLLTLTQANKIDWKNKFIELFANIIQREVVPTKIEFITNPSTELVVLPLQTPVFLYTGENIGTIDDVGKQCFEVHRNNINLEIKKQVMASLSIAFKNMMKLDISSVPLYDMFVFVNNEKAKILEIKMEVFLLLSQVIDVQPSHYFLDGNGITEFKIKDNDQTYQIIAVQEEGKDPIVKKHLIEDVVKAAAIKQKKSKSKNSQVKTKPKHKVPNS